MNDSEVKSGIHSGVGLLQKAFQLLDLFQTDAPAWSQAELARATGLPRSTTSRLARYLSDRGYLIQVDRTGRYLLGPAAIDLGRRAATNLDLRGICRPVLEQLAEETGETVILTALDETRGAVACVDQIESTHGGLRVFERVGGRFPLHAGASPRAVLAYLPKNEQARILAGPLEPTTRATLTDADEIRAELAATVERRYAVSYEETYVGVVGVAAPVFGWDARPLGSLAIAAPIQRAPEIRVREFGAMLNRAAEQVTALLRGRAEEQQ
jgi:IclR family acetate operon transcriptional repressor